MAFVAFSSFVNAQNPLPIEMSYDAAGNRITRKVMQVSMMTRGDNDSTYYLDRMHSIQLKVYPNPTQGKVCIEMQGVEEGMDSRILVFDSQGRKVYENERQGDRLELDLSEYPAGYYMVELSANGERTTWKIIKK